MLPGANLLLHPGELAARHLDSPDLLLPLCCAPGGLEQRIALLNCPRSKIVCREMCSICLWRHAHVAAAHVLQPGETVLQLTARGQSPEFNTTILVQRDTDSMVVQILSIEPAELSPMAQLFRKTLLIRRRAEPPRELVVVFRYALLAASARFALPLDIAAMPDIVDRLVALNRRIFYLLALFLVEDVAGRLGLNPSSRIPFYGQRIASVLELLPRIFSELIATNTLTARVQSEINAVSYVRDLRETTVCKLMLDTSIPDGLRARATVFNSAASLQALAVHCCGRLPPNVPRHPQVLDWLLSRSISTTCYTSACVFTRSSNVPLSTDRCAAYADACLDAAPPSAHGSF